MQRPADETLSPLGQSLGESLALGRHMLLVAAPLGALVGVAIAGYDWVVNEVLWHRITEHSAAVQMAAPFFGLLLAGLVMRLLGVSSPSMADEVVKAYHDPGKAMPTRTAAGKFIASVATMGFGGSAGMEGASKWLGATIGSVVQGTLNRLRVRGLRWNTKTTLIAGGAAGIAAIFRAPLSGAIMGVESPYKHDLAHEALLPALIASATSFWAFSHLRPATPYFPVTFHYTLDTRDLLIAVPLGLVAGLASHLFLWTLGKLRRRFMQDAPLGFCRSPSNLAFEQGIARHRVSCGVPARAAGRHGPPFRRGVRSRPSRRAPCCSRGASARPLR